jgi:GNAT superfamily N-acetyltransferase
MSLHKGPHLIEPNMSGIEFEAATHDAETNVMFQQTNNLDVDNGMQQLLNDTMLPLWKVDDTTNWVIAGCVDLCKEALPMISTRVLRLPGRHIWVITDGRVVCCMLCLREEPGQDIAEIEIVGTKHSWQDRKLGKRIMHTVLQWVRERGLSAVVAWADDGEACMRLYQAAGFLKHDFKLVGLKKRVKDATFMRHEIQPTAATTSADVVAKPAAPPPDDSVEASTPLLGNTSQTEQRVLEEPKARSRCVQRPLTERQQGVFMLDRDVQEDEEGCSTKVLQMLLGLGASVLTPGKNGAGLGWVRL